MQHHDIERAPTETEDRGWRNQQEKNLDPDFPIEGAGGIQDGGGKAAVDQGGNLVAQEFVPTSPKKNGKPRKNSNKTPQPKKPPATPA